MIDGFGERLEKRQIRNRRILLALAIFNLVATGRQITTGHLPFGCVSAAVSIILLTVWWRNRRHWQRYQRTRHLPGQDSAHA